jgi:hypothetical protein
VAELLCSFYTLSSCSHRKNTQTLVILEVRVQRTEEPVLEVSPRGDAEGTYALNKCAVRRSIRAKRVPKIPAILAILRNFGNPEESQSIQSGPAGGRAAL